MNQKLRKCSLKIALFVLRTKLNSQIKLCGRKDAMLHTVTPYKVLINIASERLNVHLSDIRSNYNTILSWRNILNI
jgi:hypothetical protein